MSDDFKIGRTPDYVLKASIKVDGEPLKGGRVGVAWKNKNGSITIRLNDFVALPTQAGQLALTLFPQTPQEATSDEGGDR